MSIDPAVTAKYSKPQIVGWKVYRGEKRKSARSAEVILVKWTPISTRFTIKSAADTFYELARKEFGPVVLLEVRAIYKQDNA